MFKIFYQTSEQEDPQQNLITEASNQLDVGEFQLFQLSYQAWFGKEPDLEWLDLYFFAYLVHDNPPPWARHYARKVLDDVNDGTVDSRGKEYHQFDQQTSISRPWIGLFVVAMTVGVVATFLILIIANAPGSPLCMFPPCY